MAEHIIYVDHSEIRDGKFEELKMAMIELAQFVKANEPQLLVYNVYFSEDRARMTVIHIHRDAASLEFHMRVAGPLFPKFAGFIKLLRIDLYGKPSEHIVEQLKAKAEMLGSGTVLVHQLHAGFARFPL
jgi:quinol monooxygenase YgiN